MQIHRVMGTSLREALGRARRAHGEDAIVISQEISAGGAVTLAVARRPGAALENAAPKLSAAMLREMTVRLRRQGASEPFVERISKAVQAAREQDKHVLDRAADAIGSSFRTATLVKHKGAARVLALVGSTGVGKTTTIAKLALRLVRSGRKIEIVTFDTNRVGATEALRAWAELFGVPFRALKPDFKLPADAFANVDLALIDTTGSPRADLENLEQLRRASSVLASGAAQLETHLVVPATATAGALRSVSQALWALRPTAVIVTKLDETNEPAPALEYVLSAGLPVAFLCNGPDVGAHLLRPEADHFADLFLRGKIT
jgi:flagellar biosynthesis GTPase FlhF